MHNSFDVEEANGKFVVVSHNFREIIGIGSDAKEAIQDLNRKIIYYRDNNEKEFNDRIRARIKKGMACECGEKLEAPVVAIM